MNVPSKDPYSDMRTSHTSGAATALSPRTSCPLPTESGQYPLDCSFLPIIIDSGASSHMLPIATNLHDYTVIRDLQVGLGDTSVKLDVAGIGGTNLLNEVLHVPRLSFGLISIGKLDRDGCVTVFKEGRVTVFDSEGETLLTGTRRQKLYHLDDHYKPLFLTCDSTARAATTMVSQSSQSSLSVSDYLQSQPGVHVSVEQCLALTRSGLSTQPKSTTADHENILEILHRRWGHASETAIKKILKRMNVDGAGVDFTTVKDLHLPYCEDCYKGKMRQSSNKQPSQEVWEVLEKIGIDWKDLPKQTPYKEKGFFLFSDQKSHYVFPYLCGSRSEALPALQFYLESVVKPAGAIWKVLQGDSDSAFLSSQVVEWLMKKHIRLQLSAPYKHSQNGMVERDMQSVLDRARTISSVYNTPQCYYGFAVEMACYLLNTTSSPESTGVTPYELVHKTRPDVSILVPFYSPGVYRLSKDERRHNSWKFKAEPCRLLGIDPRGKRTYYVLNLRTRAILSRTDCVFDETLRTVLRHSGMHPDDPSAQSLLCCHSQECWSAGGEGADSTSSDNTFSPALEADLDEDGDDLVATSCSVNDAVDDWWSEIVLLVHPELHLPPSPKTLSEALEGPERDKWMEAILKELDQLDQLSVFGDAEQKGRGMKVKLILRISFTNDLQLKYKARLVGCGYSQQFGLDYNETYSPTVSTMVINLMIHLAASMGLCFGTFDVSGAFLEAFNDFDNYAWLPEELFGKKIRVKLVKALYGQKQAPKLWSDRLHSILTSMGFQRCPVVPCLYMWRNGDKVVYLCAFVDDGLLCANDESILRQFESELGKHVTQLTLKCPLQRYVGVTMQHDKSRGIVECSQPDHINDLPEGNKKVEVIPMSNTYNLRKEQPNSSNSSLLPITGKLRYLADRTRWDILTAVGEMSSGGADSPSDNHVKTAYRTIDYLRNTKEETLNLGGPDCNLFAFSDASYITEGDSKSRLGGCLFLGSHSGAFYSFSKLAGLVSQSSTHAEILALFEVVRLVEHTRQVLEFLGNKQSEPTKIYVDNTSAIDLCEALKITHKTSSVNVRVNTVKENIQRGVIALHFIPTHLNVADILTKPLAHELFIAHRKKLLRGFYGRSVYDTEHTAVLVLDVDSLATMLAADDEN